MSTYKFLLLLGFYFTTSIVNGQNNKAGPRDSSVQFKVFGTCELCQQRIEEAVKGKGVKEASWNIESKQLTLVYQPTKTTLQKIKNRIVAAGHDLETIKTKDFLYNELPKCCRYREMESMTGSMQMEVTPMETTASGLPNDSSLQNANGSSEQFIQGVVLESNKDGTFNPLAGASVMWSGTTTGVFTDSTGVFRIRRDVSTARLVVSYSGYRPDTLSVTDIRELKIILATGKQLREVVITSKQRSTYLSAINPVRTQIMTERELYKAACCNLSESFETNPSVDVTYNDAVTGSKQIQLLGLSGNYTQLTVENLPGPRGIATPLGLNSIAGPWIESIQLTKGIGSVANGYESIAGQINVELKKPENSEQLYANLYINDFGKTDVNLNMAKKIAKRWSTGLLIHDDFLSNAKVDYNKDGFRDLPTGNQFSLINRWKYDDGNGLLAQFGVKILWDRRTGGETQYEPSRDKYTMNHYGLGINTNRYEGFAKVGYVFPEKKYKSIGLQLSGISHHQDSYFGQAIYDGRQRTIYGNLLYQSIINSTAHKFRAGVSFLYDQYNENYNNGNFLRNELVPGAFVEYTYSYLDKLSVVGGIRADDNSLFGFFLTPRLHVRYAPVTGTTIRLSAGRGQRTANIFAENMSLFASARQLQIIAATTTEGYGLQPEVAWNKGISVDQQFKLFQRDALISVDYFRNDFRNQVVVDLEDPRWVKFYNLNGKSFSNSFQAELNAAPLKKLEVRLAYRHFDVRTTYSGNLRERPFISPNRAFVNFAYMLNGWKIDYTVSYSDQKRLPSTSANPVLYRRAERSPAFATMNAQVSKIFGKKHPIEIYAGGENLTNFYQQQAIIAAEDPFSAFFDASMIWGPVIGRMFYGGLRYKVQK